MKLIYSVNYISHNPLVCVVSATMAATANDVRCTTEPLESCLSEFGFEVYPLKVLWKHLYKMDNPGVQAICPVYQYVTSCNSRNLSGSCIINSMCEYNIYFFPPLGKYPGF